MVLSAIKFSPLATPSPLLLPIVSSLHTYPHWTSQNNSQVSFLWVFESFLQWLLWCRLPVSYSSNRVSGKEEQKKRHKAGGGRVQYQFWAVCPYRRGRHKLFQWEGIPPFFGSKFYTCYRLRCMRCQIARLNLRLLSLGSQLAKRRKIDEVLRRLSGDCSIKGVGRKKEQVCSYLLCGAYCRGLKW